MKFQNFVVTFGFLFYWSSSIAAVPKTTVYPSMLFPGKMWVAPTTDSSTPTEDIWHAQESQEVRYRPLDDEKTAPQHHSERSEYCIPMDATQPPQQYRSEREDMPHYRSEVSEMDADFGERPRHNQPPEDLPPPPSRRYDFDMPHYRGLSSKVPPLWDWMNDPSFSDLNPPVNPYDWGAPYLRNNFSAADKAIEQPLPSLQIPLKNPLPPTVPTLTISADWIPAPNSALVDSDEFKPNYVTLPRTMTLGEIKP